MGTLAPVLITLSICGLLMMIVLGTLGCVAMYFHHNRDSAPIDLPERPKWVDPDTEDDCSGSGW